MDVKEIVSSLHPLERKVLPLLSHKQSVSQIIETSGMLEVEVLRAIGWLESKGIINTKSDLSEQVLLDSNGERYAKSGLPERTLLHTIEHGPMSIEEIQKHSKLDLSELQAAIGVLRSAALISFGADKRITLTDAGKNAIKKERLEDKFLTRLDKEKSIEVLSLLPEEKFALESLRKRKLIIRFKINKAITFNLTGLGKQLLSSGLSFENVVDTITPEMLASGAWKNKTFRAFDVSQDVQKIYFGRRHHYKSFLDEVRKKFLALGFSEMSGPLVETDFWDMDALFMPQFHSARDIHQAYYVKEPTHGEVDEAVLKRVKAAHENGGGTGSKGWEYKFDTERTKRLLLRTQGTACSARKLNSPGLKIPGKYFALSKCFRYDVIDATHLPDFFQTEGIIVEEGLTFRHLKGLLKLFAEEFAKTSEIRLKPGYFPFTEPSCELYAKHPDLGWIELGGAGIFRPELTNALGVKVPVIAWGLGIDRIGMFNMGIKDIRSLYSTDLSMLRNIKVI